MGKPMGLFRRDRKRSSNDTRRWRRDKVSRDGLSLNKRGYES